MNYLTSFLADCMKLTTMTATDRVYDFAVTTVANFFDFVYRNSTEDSTRIIELPVFHKHRNSTKDSTRVIELPPSQKLHDIKLDQVVDPVFSTEVRNEAVDESVAETFRSTADIFDTNNRPDKNTVMYIGSMDAPLHRNPTMEYDGIVMHLAYGTMVMVLEQRGRWSKVVVAEIDGWVLRDDLIDRAAYVYPHFVIGERNECDDPNTVRLRAVIKDEFMCGVAGLPLQSSEYVYFRLYRKGISVAWSEVRPRTEGAWHTILKGVLGVHIGVRPKTGSIMEYTLEDGSGHLAYVESVFPDETITISETNFPEGGIYNERVLTREEWRELKPVFIQVS